MTCPICLELWRWRWYDPVRRKRCTTSFMLMKPDAALQYPDGCEKVASSLEVRMVPETYASRRRLCGFRVAFFVLFPYRPLKSVCATVQSL